MLFACNEVEQLPSESNETESDTEIINAPQEDDPETTKEDEEDLKKSIDLYIIAGQSNAAGYTKINNTVLLQLWNKASTGSSNVLYAGRAEYSLNVNTPQVSTVANEVQWTNAKTGQGKTTSHMGVEVGMAKVLSEEYYTGNKTAGIIKFAHGGTSLIGGTGSENAANGNWVPPSFAKLKGWSYTGIHGGLYRGLLAQVEKNISELKTLGYEEISIKGLFWMQGESDAGCYASVYEKAFECLVNDLRNDLGKITEEDLSVLPIIVGEISETMGSASAGQVAINQSFINIQRGLAEKNENVYILPTSQYLVNTWTDQGDKRDPFQNDPYHWNTEQIFQIGELVGRCIIDNILN